MNVQVASKIRFLGIQNVNCRNILLKASSKILFIAFLTKKMFANGVN